MPLDAGVDDVDDLGRTLPPEFSFVLTEEIPLTSAATHLQRAASEAAAGRASRCACSSDGPGRPHEAAAAQPVETVTIRWVARVSTT